MQVFTHLSGSGRGAGAYRMESGYGGLVTVVPYTQVIRHSFDYITIGFHKSCLLVIIVCIRAKIVAVQSWFNT